MEGESLDQPAEVKQLPPQFTVSHQKVHLELDFCGRLHGWTEITIHPLVKDISTIKLHARQCQITQLTVNRYKSTCVSYKDPCDVLCLHTESDVHQSQVLSSKLHGSFSEPAVEELTIPLPKQIKIEEVNQLETQIASAGPIRIPKPDEANVDVEETVSGLADTTIAKYTPLTLKIHFDSIHTRDALQFVTGSGRWPHVYTREGFGAGIASSLFPCVDTLEMRCTWEFSIKSVRTVGAAVRQLSRQTINKNDEADLAHEEREMIFVCTGEITDEVIDKLDPSKKTVTFSSSPAVLSARQIGFAVAPFEKVNLAEFRDAQEIQELGKNAVDMIAYCLPGRTDEARNTCLPLTNAMDYYVKRYCACPYKRFGLCFVEDVVDEPYIFAEVGLCSTRMLYPEDIIDPAQNVTRSLVHIISSQWLGMQIIADEPRDQWVIIGASRFLTDIFMKELCGNNEYRYHMKTQSNKVVDLDQERPSIHEMGAILRVDPSVYKFMALKCPVVFFILDRRMAKVTGTSKMPAILGKILTRARTDDLSNNVLSTDYFQKMVEKFYHQRIDDFMLQWVKGAGCPRFQATQRFNKKKLVIELQIRQIHVTHATEKELEVDTFMRDVREDFNGVWAAEPQKVFTGPMTIRIHEADGTPYEHIVEIKDAVTTVDIPYNTKYKRLKRTKKQKSRAANKVVSEEVEDGDALLYCLGDVLQSEEDTVNWRLTDWTAEEEEKMSAESFEWMRLDADFEWIAHTKISMGGHMFVSQLQQDRDVIAQLDSVNVMAMYAAQSLVSTILLRTMMDTRYFHGIRTAAAEALVKHARKEVNYIGLFHLQKAFETLYMSNENESAMTRPNDFSDQLSYYLQCALIGAISKVRDDQGVAPPEVKEFLLDKLKFNDNSANEYSDSFYVSHLMQALTHAVLARPSKPADNDMDEDDISSDKNIAAWTAYHRGVQLEKAALEEIDRYRRMDEWTSSYQNLYSRTALDCQARLAEAGIGSVSPLHFLQYTRPANYVRLRITAYDILIRDTTLFDDTNTRSRSILRYIVHCMAADSSSEIRHALSVFFGKAFARQAIGDGNSTTVSLPTADGTSLVVENANSESESTNIEHAQREKLRRQTIEGATEALRTQTKLPENENLKKYLWTAVCFPECGFEDLKVLLEFCRLLYEDKHQAVVKLTLPKYWKVKHLGKGKLVFRRTTHVRTKIATPWKPKSAAVANTLSAGNGATSNSAPVPRPLKLNFKTQSFKASSSKNGTPTSATPTPPPPSQLSSSGTGAAPQSGRIVLKIKKQNPE